MMSTSPALSNVWVSYTGLPRVDSDGVAVAVVAVEPPSRISFSCFGLGRLVAEEGVVEDLPGVAEDELHRLARP